MVECRMTGLATTGSCKRQEVEDEREVIVSS